jgi:AraC-like DNA-binding protein
VDVLYRKIVQGVDLPFCAHSTGNYREGRGFSYYREGFDSYCFFISVSGAGEVTYRGMTRRMERGDMIFVSSAIPARVNSMTDDWHFCFVNIAGDYCEQYERLWNEGGLEIIRPQDPTHYLGLVDRISAELKKPYLAGELTVNALVTVLLTDALVERYDSGESDRRGSLYPTWVQEAAAILSERCSEEIRVSDLAARFYMEQNSFIRRFKRYTGKTPKEYQIVCRMERATALLSDSDLSMSEIAARCGFASHSFFSKTFKRLYGVTPTEYRHGLLKK